MKTSNGGSAFPRAGFDSKFPKDGTNAVDGMSLRDYFAAQAGATMYANSWLVEKASSDWVENGGNRPTCVAEWFSGMAYEFADAMLTQRSK